MEASPGKSLPSRFQTGPEYRDPMWSRSTTKVDGMKRSCGAWYLFLGARRALCFLRLLAPKMCVISVHRGGIDRLLLLLFVIFQPVFFPPCLHSPTVNKPSISLLREEGVPRFFPLYSLAPSSLNPRRRRATLLSFSRSILSSSTSPVRSHYIRYTTVCLLVPGAWVLPASPVEVDLSMQDTHSVHYLGPWGIQGSCGL